MNYIKVQKLKQSFKQQYLCHKNQLQYLKGKYHQYFYSIIQIRQLLFFYTDHIIILQKPKKQALKKYDYKIFITKQVNDNCSLPLKYIPNHYRSFNNHKIKNIQDDSDRFIVNFKQEENSSIVFRIKNVKLKNQWFQLLKTLSQNPIQFKRLEYIEDLQLNYLSRKWRQQHKDKQSDIFGSRISLTMKKEMDQCMIQRGYNPLVLSKVLISLQNEHKQKWNNLALIQNQLNGDNKSQDENNHELQFASKILSKIEMFWQQEIKSEVK